MRVLGCDPGIRGGLCVLQQQNDGARLEVVDIIDVPTVGDGNKREINVLMLRDWLLAVRPDLAFIEFVTAMPSIAGADGVRRGMGATSAFHFGGAVYALRAVIACCDVPYRLVTPPTWKKPFGLKGPDKEQSRQAALRRVPQASRWLTRKLDHQRAEAVLIALYGMTVQRWTPTQVIGRTILPEPKSFNF